jgi:thioredoxin 2
MTDALLLACPRCSTLNRFPRERLAAGNTGKCGQCSSPLFDGHPVDLGAGNFEAHAAKSDLPVLVDFWAPWCGPCKAIAPIVEEIAGEYDGKLKVTKLNVDDHPATAAKYGIRGIPNLIILKGGAVKEQIVGAVPKTKLVAAIDKALQ